MQQILSPHQLDFYTAMIWTWSVAFLPRLVTTTVLLAAGFLFSSWVARNLRVVLARTGRVDATIQPVIAAIIRYAILIFVFIAALSQIGVQTASLFAILGAAGLAIGLALQGTLTNIAAGVMLLWLRPFRLNDYIEVPANNISGTVKEIGLFMCMLETFDGITIFAPNSAIWNSALRNHSQSSKRLISLIVTLPNSADVAKAAHIVTTTLLGDARVLKSSRPLVFVEAQNPNGILLNCSFHVQPDKVGEVQRTVIDDAERQLKAAGVETLAPQQIARVVPADADPSRIMASQRQPSPPHIN
ncbi:MAG: mechanosensitive ion channel family protein [Deltaproteobacteria bacterium]|nr:mechanosensitive ion channel family protein [Deltaproteobacteria bacterium]